MSSPAADFIPLGADDGNAEPRMSKTREKRLAKAAAAHARKAERKAKSKANLRDLRAKRAAGELPADVHIPTRKRRKVEPPARAVKPFGARVVIDLGFDDMMTEREVVSLASQLAYTYSSNRMSLQPFQSLLMSSLGGKTRDRLESVGDGAYKRWTGVEWWGEGYEKLWESAETIEPEASTSPTSSETYQLQTSRCHKSTVVYLTADAEDEITELREGETYIIGGICDHNRYKSLCLNKAQRQSIRVAKLPIGTCIASMPSRKVLTVNQVFDILLGWVVQRDWEKALYAIIPARKFKTGESVDLPGEVVDLVETGEGEEHEDELKVEAAP